MSDEADRAAAIEAEMVARGLQQISPDIPVGTAGECDECGELMPRLVGGRCGFCRDGRRPPLSRFDSLPVPEVPDMPAYKDGKYISVPADGATLKVIEQRAARDDVALGQAALDLIKEGFGRLAVVDKPAAIEVAPSEWDGTREGAVVFLENVPDAWLTEELIRRFEKTVGAEDHAAVAQQCDAAIARAEAAEGQLATVRQQLSGVLADIGQNA